MIKPCQETPKQCFVLKTLHCTAIKCSINTHNGTAYAFHVEGPRFNPSSELGRGVNQIGCSCLKVISLMPMGAHALTEPCLVPTCSLPCSETKLHSIGVNRKCAGYLFVLFYQIYIPLDCKNNTKAPSTQFTKRIKQ